MDPRPSARTMCVRVRQALVVRGRDEVGSALGRRRSSCWRTLMLRASAVRQLSSAERELPLEEDERARSSRPGESAEGGRVRGGEGRTHRSAGLVTMAAVCEHQGNAVSSCAGGKSLQVASTASRKGSRCEGRGGGGRDEGEGDDGPCCSRLRGRSFSRASPCRPCRPGGCGRPSRRRSSEMARVGEEGRGGAGRRRLAGTAVRARVRLGAARLEGASSGGCAALRGGGRGSPGACGPRAPPGRRCRSRAHNLDAANSHLLLLVHSASSSRSQTHSHPPSEKHRSATRPRAAHRASCRALPGIAAALAQARLALSMLLLSTTLSQVRQRSANEEQTMQGATRNDEGGGIT